MVIVSSCSTVDGDLAVINGASHSSKQKLVIRLTLCPTACDGPLAYPGARSSNIANLGFGSSCADLVDM
jgi:hypothetical protein